MGTTKIEWTDETWNPVTGCTPVSEGCANCYARKMAYRLQGRCGYPADEPFRVTVRHDRLLEPNRWRKPRHCFVCSMGDLFHRDVSRDTIIEIFMSMATTPLSTFQVLTKRPERMLGLLRFDGFAADGFLKIDWPLPNVWLGTSCETQQRADERIPKLLGCPAAVRFVSLEPLLGPVDLRSVRFSGTVVNSLSDAKGPQGGGGRTGSTGRVNQVIIGCESRGSRLGRLSVDGAVTATDWWGWVGEIAGECVEAGVPLFIKQGPSLDGKRLVKMPEFDGRVWDEMPEAAEATGVENP